MGINISKPTYAKWPVKFKLTDPDGSIREEEGIVHYAVSPGKEAEDLEALKLAIVGWEPDAFHDNGVPVEFSEKNKDALCANSEIRNGLVVGFYQIWRGEHLLKNLPTSSTG